MILIILVKAQRSGGLNFKIDEESPPNSYIGSLEQADCGKPVDAPKGKYPNYRLVSENTIFLSHIDINRSSGKMTLKHSIDRDSMCVKMQLCCKKAVERSDIVYCVIQLKAMVELIDVDGSTYSTSHCNVNLEIVDINDHSPTFTMEKFIINISEAATMDSILSLPAAIDADSSKFSVSRYYLKETSRYFRVEYSEDNNGGTIPKLIVKGRLDREEIAEHQLTLIAVDAGFPPKSGSLNIIIKVLDENDNEPIIEPLSPISVKEDLPIGHRITQIQAHDKDAGENAFLSYYLQESSSRNNGKHFKINHLNGEITLSQKVDYDSMYQSPQVELVITVKDHGRPKTLSSTTTLTISIVDVNDEAPRISIIDLYSRQPAKPEIRENLLQNQFVAFVNVQDDDHGINGQIKCELLGEHNDFGLESIEHNTLKDRYEFKIVTKTRLDCEKQAMYTLVISCWDMGQPRQSSQEEVVVKVVDVNDNSPSFGSSKIELELEENQPQGTLVATLNVTDLDQTDISNGHFEYIINDYGKRYFRIEPIEGRGQHDNAKLRIYTLQSFDREKTFNMEFELIVKDVNWGNSVGSWQSLSSTSTVVVNMVDQNDNSPIFSKLQYEFSIEEEKGPGQLVGILQATDEDQGNNGKIVFKIEDYAYNIQNIFALDSNTGTMISRAKIDREKTASFQFKIRASDLGRPSRSNSVNVLVKVTDVNDNYPKFIYPTVENHTVLASIFYLEGSPIMKINAIDNDEAGKNQITYTVDSGDDTNLFQIDSNQGGISFSRKPKNSDAKSYFLTIKATDSDDHPKSTKITIHLKLDESRQTFMGQDYRRMNANGDIDDPSTIDGLNRTKFPINRNILLVICLIVISATLAGVLLMLIMCLKKRPQPGVSKTNPQPTYQDCNKNKTFGTYKSDPTNASNLTLNYRMIPAERYQDLLHDQGGYSGLSFFRKNNNITGVNNDPAMCFLNNGGDGYQWLNNTTQASISPAGDSVYHKISSGIELSSASTRKQIISDQIPCARDDPPRFLASYGCAADQQPESQPRLSNDRYQTLNASSKAGPLNSQTSNDAEKNLLDHEAINGMGTPKRSLVASSFV